MLTFDLFVDASLVFSGAFEGPAVKNSLVTWGDDIIGGASLARWDYFRFGVVPEANTVWIALMLGLAVLKGTRSRLS